MCFLYEGNCRFFDVYFAIEKKREIKGSQYCNNDMLFQVFRLMIEKRKEFVKKDDKCNSN